MSVRERSALITWTTGVPTGAPVVLLHDRYLDHEANDALAAAFAPTHRVVSVRSARTQMEMGLIKGYYWFLGDLDRPELSTLGDGLSHLERLLLTLNEETGQRIVLVGQGEGGSIALLISLVWPELIAGVASIDGPLPSTTAGLPVETKPVTGLPVLLVDGTRNLLATSVALATRGAHVERVDASNTPARIARWATGLSVRV